MKRIAEMACRKLAVFIFEGGGLESLYRRADRIERRFHIFGCTEAFLADMGGQWQAMLDREMAAHDTRQPDRRTYLHR